MSNFDEFNYNPIELDSFDHLFYGNQSNMLARTNSRFLDDNDIFDFDRYEEQQQLQDNSDDNLLKFV